MRISIPYEIVKGLLFLTIILGISKLMLVLKVGAIVSVLTMFTVQILAVWTFYLQTLKQR